MTTELTTNTKAGDLQVGTLTQDWGRAAAAWLANLKSDNTRRAYLAACVVNLVYLVACVTARSTRCAL